MMGEMALNSLMLWLLFFIFILGAAGYDLFRLGGRKKEMGLREAGLWTVAWITLAIVFGILIFFIQGGDDALDYFTAYLLEKSLSLDNLFVFLVIFSYFDLGFLSQQKVLKWGILGAFLMRAIFIFGGIWLLQTFRFLFYFFGAFLIFSAFKLLVQKEEKIDPQKNLFLRFVRKILPLSPSQENRFFIRGGLERGFTTLFLVLLLIESSDLVFALDSVPAVLAVTQNPFLAYTSNGFAILGLRALYFFLIGFLPKFIYLKKGIVILLAFIGTKMLLSDLVHIRSIYSLIIVFIIIVVSIILSLVRKQPVLET